MLTEDGLPGEGGYLDDGSSAYEELQRFGERAAGTAGRTGVRACRAAGRGAVQAGRLLLRSAAAGLRLLAAFIPAAGAAVLITALIVVFILEERGSTESNLLDPYADNPVWVDQSTGVAKAAAMAEPQAVTDAYYKYMACSSYQKVYGDRTLMFSRSGDTGDFAALRDYFKREEYFYLSDDFIRMTDELLHRGEVWYPEQVIRPVFGQELELTDGNGKTGTFYVARLPVDTGDGSRMLDPDTVKDFAAMLADPGELKVPEISGTAPVLIARSAAPADRGDGTYTMDGAGGETEPGLWDYGFGSVLTYQPEEKDSWISCSYDSVDVDWDVRTLDPETGEWSDWSHDHVEAEAADCTLEELTDRCSRKLEERNTETAEYRYQLPVNIAAILDDSAAWDMSLEPGGEKEQEYADVYGSTVTNSRIEGKITDPWDREIDSLTFSDPELQEAFGNRGGGLYPIRIAVTAHAATATGNIHYGVTSAGEPGCDETSVPLAVNSVPVADHRESVQTVLVAGGCGEVPLTAHRTGTVTTVQPRVEETDSPWGSAYLHAYADSFTGYVPEDVMEDMDFFVRSGLKPNADSEMKEEYRENLDYLLDLGLLRLSSSGLSLERTGTVDLSTAEDPDSDLYILSHVIAAEAGSSKLDQLMVGSVFVNRVYSDRFPDTYREVLVQPSQYSSYPVLYSRVRPSEQIVASAIQVMTGQFTIPENVIGQSAFIQGTIYTMVDNPSPQYDHYYCTGNRDAPSSVDRYGRPAPEPSQLQAMADALDGVSPEEAAGSGSLSPSLYEGCVFAGDELTLGLNRTAELEERGALVIARQDAGFDELAEMVKNADLSGARRVWVEAGLHTPGEPAEAFKSACRELLDTLEQKTGGAQITLVTLPGGEDAEAKNALLDETARELGLPLLRLETLQPDSTPGSLTEEFYRLWAAQITPAGNSSTGGSSGDDALWHLSGPDGSQLYSDFTLYAVDSFDVLEATRLQARVTQAESGLLASVKRLMSRAGDLLLEAADSLTDFFEAFFHVTDSVFRGKADSSPVLVRCAAPVNGEDADSVAPHTLAFSQQIWFSDAREQIESGDEGELRFFFSGSRPGAADGTGAGSSGGSVPLVPGTGTSEEGLESPTESWYPVRRSWTSSAGYAELAVPAGTEVLAPADGTVTEAVEDAADDTRRSVTLRCQTGGAVYEFTFSCLSALDVTAGQQVKQGDRLGLSGTLPDGSPLLRIRVVKDGVCIDPMTVFYQPVPSTSPGLGGNLNNPDGTVNEQKIQELEDRLTAFVNGGGWRNSPWYTPPVNGLQYKQCTWWARGRGLEYLMTVTKSVTAGQFIQACTGNGGDYYASNLAAGLFNSGTTPKPNSLVCFRITRPEQKYGHIAYVEAVDYVNKVYYMSEAGSGTYWGGIVKKAFGSSYRSSHYGLYQPGIFIYLDEPLK